MSSRKTYFHYRSVQENGLQVFKAAETHWLRFEKVADNTRTIKIDVVPKEGHGPIGQIHWYHTWRKYCFFPEWNCVFETQCLSDIIKVVNNLNLEHKANLQWKKTNQVASATK